MSLFKKEKTIDIKKTIIDLIPTALKNLGITENVDRVENYIVNRIIEASTELRKLSDKEFVKFLKSL